MPNWTNNTIDIKGKKKELDEIKESLMSEDSDFDFNAIIPMPKSLDLESGTTTDYAIIVYLTDKLQSKPDGRKAFWKKAKKLVSNMFDHDWATKTYNILRNDKKLSDEELNKYYELGKQYVSNYDNYGATTWYEWCCRNWGTKWNACDAYMDESSDNLHYSFDTAWCAPFPVILRLSQKYPSTTISHSWIDEDDPVSIKTMIYRDGICVLETIKQNEDYCDW